MRKLAIIFTSAVFLCWAFGTKENGAAIARFFFGSPHTKVNRWVVGPGEYVNSLIDRNTGRCYEFLGVPRLLSPLHCYKTVGGAHHSLVLDSLSNGGNVYAWGDNTSGELGDGTTTNRTNPVQLLTDSLGNPFNNVIDIWAGGTDGGWMSGALKADGTVWVWGEVTDGVRGNGTPGGLVLKPVQVTFPGGVFITQVILNELCIAKSSTGDVYTWGAKNEDNGNRTPYMLAQGSGTVFVTNLPTKITLPAPATMICGGSDYGNYALLNNGKLYGWGYNLQYMGVRGARDLSNFGWKPFDITDTLLLTAGTIDTIVSNSMATVIIKTDSTMWGWGDNSSANMGQGPGLNMRFLSYFGFASPWGWDGGQIESQPPNFKPVQIAAGMHNFTKVFAGISFCFEFFAQNAHDSLFSWGRNKYQVTNAFITEIDSTNGVLGAAYANNWDENWIRFIDPFRTTHIVRTTGRICKDSAGIYCNFWPWDNSKSGPAVFSGSNQTITTTFTTLKGSFTIAPGVSGRLNSLWTCIGKPVGAADPLIPIRSSDTSAVSNLTTQGTYTFKYWVEDANFKADSATMSVFVTSGPLPPTYQGIIRNSYYHHKYIRQ